MLPRIFRMLPSSDARRAATRADPAAADPHRGCDRQRQDDAGAPPWSRPGTALRRAGCAVPRTRLGTPPHLPRRRAKVRRDRVLGHRMAVFGQGHGCDPRAARRSGDLADYPYHIVRSRLVRRTLSRGVQRTELWNGNREKPLWEMLRGGPEENILRWQTATLHDWRDRMPQSPPPARICRSCGSRTLVRRSAGCGPRHPIAERRGTVRIAERPGACGLRRHARRRRPPGRTAPRDVRGRASALPAEPP